MHLLPSWGLRLKACCVWATVCLTELSQGRQKGTSGNLVSASACEVLLVPNAAPGPHLNCRKYAQEGVFGMVYDLMQQGLQVRLFRHLLCSTCS